MKGAVDYKTEIEITRNVIRHLERENDRLKEFIKKLKCCGSCIHAHLVNTGLGCFNPTLTATGEPDDYNVVILDGDCERWEARW